MNKCNFCNVYIKDDSKSCPLCGGVLELDGSGVNTYPDIRKKMRVVSLLFRILVFTTCIAAFTCIVINYFAGSSFKWSFIVTLSLLYLNAVMYMFVVENMGYRIRSFGIAIFGVLLLIYIDHVTGFHRWSLNYVLPSAIIFIDAALILLMIVNQRNFQSYTTIVIAMAVLSVMPLVLYKFRIITSPLVSIIAFVISLFEMLGVILFGGQRVKNELHRRFYIDK